MYHPSEKEIQGLPPELISWNFPTSQSHRDIAGQALTHIENRTYPLVGDLYSCPVKEFIDPARIAAEEKALFREYPLVFGVSSQVKNPGDFFTDDYLGIPILITRTNAGKVQAYLNICKHRGAKVAEGCGKGRRAFSCRYHGWTYNREGCLIGNPTDGSFEGVDKATHGLTPLPTAEKHGLIWVRPSPGADFDPDQMLAGLETDMATYGMGDWHYAGHRVLHRKCNWKFAMHTFLEAYHFKYLHSKNIYKVAHDIGMFEPFGRNLRLWVIRRTLDKLRRESEQSWSLLDHSTAVHILFPNIAIVLVGGHAQFWRMFPAGKNGDECVLDFAIYTQKPVIDDDARAFIDTQFEFTMEAMTTEDFPCVEMGQVATQAGGPNHFVYGRNEPALGHFHRAVNEALSKAT